MMAHLGNMNTHTSTQYLSVEGTSGVRACNSVVYGILSRENAR